MGAVGGVYLYLLNWIYVGTLTFMQPAGTPRYSPGTQVPRGATLQCNREQQYKGGSGWGVSVSIYMQLAGLTRPIWRRPCPLPHHHLLLPGGGGGGEGGGQGQQGQHGQGGGSAAQYGVAPVHSHHIIISSCVAGRPTFF